MMAGPILEECRLLLVGFGKAVLEHYNCDSNMVAHVLAENDHIDPSNLWLDSSPPFISELLADNVSVV